MIPLSRLNQLYLVCAHLANITGYCLGVHPDGDRFAIYRVQIDFEVFRRPDR